MTIRRAIIAAGMFALIVSGISTPATAARKPYDPAIIYPGPYQPEQLFFRSPKGVVWLNWSNAVYTRSVKCRVALKSLKLTGFWQGHLKPGGACGTPSEPSDWALGNWINYDLLGTPVDRE